MGKLESTTIELIKSTTATTITTVNSLYYHCWVVKLTGSSSSTTNKLVTKRVDAKCRVRFALKVGLTLTLDHWSIYSKGGSFPLLRSFVVMLTTTRKLMIKVID